MLDYLRDSDLFVGVKYIMSVKNKKNNESSKLHPFLYANCCKTANKTQKFPKALS
jgi:hypothetical protein